MQTSRRAFLGFIAVATAGALAGCSTFRPVYGNNEMGLAFNVEGPTTTLDRIAYREFVSRFENSAAADVPTFHYTVTTAGLGGQMSALPADPVTGSRSPLQVSVRSTITATIKWQGDVVFEVTRFADAGYTVGRLTPVDLVAREEAEERATKAAAESIRIAVLAEYPKHEQMWSRAIR